MFFQVFLLFGVAGSIKSMPSGYSLDAEFNFHHHVFSGISCFWGSGARQKYAECVLIEGGIKFRIQQALSIEIWVKTKGDMSKIQTKKYFFLVIPIPKFILKRCLRPLWYFKFKAILLANTWWHGIWIKVKRPILSWNFL